MPEVVIHFAIIALVLGAVIGLLAWAVGRAPFIPERSRRTTRWAVIAAGLLLAILWLVPLG
jgi:uncharacterized membrane-anchored protein